MQVPKNYLWTDKSGYGEYLICFIKGIEIYRSRMQAGLCADVCWNSTKIQCIIDSRLFERKEFSYDI